MRSERLCARVNVSSTGGNSYLLYIRSGSGARPDPHPGPQRRDSRVRDVSYTETNRGDERPGRTVRVGGSGLSHTRRRIAEQLPQHVSRAVQVAGSGFCGNCRSSLRAATRKASGGHLGLSAAALTVGDQRLLAALTSKSTGHAACAATAPSRRGARCETLEHIGRA